MILYKKYVDEKKIEKTTFGEQKKNLSKAFIDLIPIRDLLDRGKLVYTCWAVYSKNKEDL